MALRENTAGHAGAQRIERLEERHPLERSGCDDVIGMHDLGGAAIPLDARPKRNGSRLPAEGGGASPDGR